MQAENGSLQRTAHLAQGCDQHGKPVFSNRQRGLRNHIWCPYGWCHLGVVPARTPGRWLRWLLMDTFRNFFTKLSRPMAYILRTPPATSGFLQKTPERYLQKMSSSPEPSAPPLYQPVSEPEGFARTEATVAASAYLGSAPPLSAPAAGVPVVAPTSAPFTVAPVAAAAAYAAVAPSTFGAPSFGGTTPVYQQPTMPASHAPYSVLQSLRKIRAAHAPKVETVAATVVAAVVEQPRSSWQQPSDSLYNRIEQIFGAGSKSSAYLSGMGLLSKFTGDQAMLSFSMTPTGSMVACIDSEEGFRRTIVFHSNGFNFQRVTSPSGQELARFAADETLQKAS